MKKSGLIFCLFVMVIGLFFTSNSAFAGYEVNEKGEVREVLSRWRPLSVEERTSCETGREVPVSESLVGTTYERVDFFHHTPVREYDKVFVCKDGKLQTTAERSFVRGETRLTAHTVFLMVGVCLLVVSNVAMVLRFSTSFVSTFSAAVAVSAFAIAIAAAIAAAFAIAAAAIVAAVSAVSAFSTAVFAFTVATSASDIRVRESVWKYWVSSGLCYIFLVIAMFV